MRCKGYLVVSQQLQEERVCPLRVRHLLEAVPLGPKPTATFDVSTSKDKAQRLYQPLGFEVVGAHRSGLANTQGVVPDHCRMQ